MMPSRPRGPLSASDAKQLTTRVREHRRAVADKMLANIYGAIYDRARYGDKALSYSMPAVTNTIYDTDAVYEIIENALVVRNFKVLRRGHNVTIAWSGH